MDRSLLQKINTDAKSTETEIKRVIDVGREKVRKKKINAGREREREAE